MWSLEELKMRERCHKSSRDPAEDKQSKRKTFRLKSTNERAAVPFWAWQGPPSRI